MIISFILVPILTNQIKMLLIFKFRNNAFINKIFPKLKLILTGGGYNKKIFPWLIYKKIIPKNELYNLIYYSKCMCVPLKFGSGTRIKIIEALSLGGIVISSKKGIEGLKLFKKTHHLFTKIKKNLLKF